MKPRIEFLPPRKLLGKSQVMTMANDQTPALFQSFMPQRKHISNKVGEEVYCIQIYDPTISLENFTEETKFMKWAAVEVADFEQVPAGLSTYTLTGGMYAVFVHKGPASEFHKTSAFIFGEWLPASAYDLDQREHFELLDLQHGPNDPEAEEEVWVPIRVRSTVK